MTEDAFASSMCFTSANSDETVEVLKLSVLGWSVTDGRLDHYLIKNVDMQRQFQVQAGPVPSSDRPRRDCLEAEPSDELDLLEDLLDRPVRQRAAATAAMSITCPPKTSSSWKRNLIRWMSCGLRKSAPRKHCPLTKNFMINVRTKSCWRSLTSMCPGIRMNGQQVQ